MEEGDELELIVEERTFVLQEDRKLGIHQEELTELLEREKELEWI